MTELTRGVVFHLDEVDPDKHRAVLANLSNILNELGHGTPVELVVHGQGLGVALAANPLSSQLRSLLDRGLSVAACANTMRSLGITADQLLTGVGIVPSGVAQLARRQWEGWAYVRP